MGWFWVKKQEQVHYGPHVLNNFSLKYTGLLQIPKNVAQLSYISSLVGADVAKTAISVWVMFGRPLWRISHLSE